MALYFTADLCAIERVVLLAHLNSSRPMSRRENLFWLVNPWAFSRVLGAKMEATTCPFDARPEK